MNAVFQINTSKRTETERKLLFHFYLVLSNFLKFKYVICILLRREHI